MTLLVKATMFLCLAVMFHIDPSDVNAYLIRNIHQCFEVCENRYWDCLVFCDMSSVKLCERRCEGMFYDCTADCPILSRWKSDVLAGIGSDFHTRKGLHRRTNGTDGWICLDWLNVSTLLAKYFQMPNIL